MGHSYRVFLSTNTAIQMEMDERPPRGKGKKRGPYKKWIALKEHFIVETDSSNTLCGTSKKAIEDHAKTFNRADDLFFLDPSTAYCEEQHT
ncbi:B9 domain-containing protein 2 isoform X3 [Ambystoma mexicanum]|uniref:B9 domain-containing protein 2 isoform X3 n=1 Tax=Ambystoma mexicanum TaxID=8296 RepID=UPI0037E79621